jgi:hypothetical protein
MNTNNEISEDSLSKTEINRLFGPGFFLFCPIQIWLCDRASMRALRERILLLCAKYAYEGSIYCCFHSFLLSTAMGLGTNAANQEHYHCYAGWLSLAGILQGC